MSNVKLGIAGLVFCLAFVLPLVQLLIWSWQVAGSDLDRRFAASVMATAPLPGLMRRVRGSGSDRNAAPLGDRECDRGGRAGAGGHSCWRSKLTLAAETTTSKAA